jgi:hypothetical protein
MNFLKFLVLLALAAWIGGISFFTIATAPTVLAHVGDRSVAGAMISEALVKLHWIGIFSAVVFLVASLIYSRLCNGSARPFSLPNLLVLIMLICTAISQFRVLPRIALLRGATHAASQAQFAHLHSVSVALEATTLVVGLLLLYLTARRLS